MFSGSVYYRFQNITNEIIVLITVFGSGSTNVFYKNSCFFVCILIAFFFFLWKLSEVKRKTKIGNPL